MTCGGVCLLGRLEKHSGQRLEQQPGQGRQVVKDVGIDSAGADCVGRDASSLSCKPPLELQRVQHIAELGTRVLGVPVDVNSQLWNTRNDLAERKFSDVMNWCSKVPSAGPLLPIHLHILIRNCPPSVVSHAWSRWCRAILRLDLSRNSSVLRRVFQWRPGKHHTERQHAISPTSVKGCPGSCRQQS